jgi:hypothetical protein
MFINDGRESSCASIVASRDKGKSARHLYTPHVDHIDECFPAGGCRHAGQEASPVVGFADFVGSLRRYFATEVASRVPSLFFNVQSCSRIQWSRNFAFKCRAKDSLTHSLQSAPPVVTAVPRDRHSACS